MEPTNQTATPATTLAAVTMAATIEAYFLSATAPLEAVKEVLLDAAVWGRLASLPCAADLNRDIMVAINQQAGICAGMGTDEIQRRWNEYLAARGWRLGSWSKDERRALIDSTIATVQRLEAARG